MMRAADCGPMPSMVVQQLADLVGVEQALDVALDLDQAAAPEVEVLAEVAGLQRRRPGRDAGRSERLAAVDQLLGQLGADQVAAVVAQLGEAPRVGAGEGLGGRVFGEEAVASMLSRVRT